jgi:hypothetical protein
LLAAQGGTQERPQAPEAEVADRLVLSEQEKREDQAVILIPPVVAEAADQMAGPLLMALTPPEGREAPAVMEATVQAGQVAVAALY